jgi:glycosidase
MYKDTLSKKWIENAVIYQILIDRFAGFTTTDGWDSPVFLGGTFRGIIDNLPYLEELGIDAIWLTPHYQCSAYHGYHITDYFQTDPHFGTIDDFQELVETVHSIDMRIIVDFVPNHCSRKHPYFQEAITDRSSPYMKWFYFTKWPDDYLSFLSIHEIPKLKLSYTPVRNHILDAIRFWLSLGVDGVRLDHVIGPSHQFWQYFSNKIEAEFPRVVLLGEAWMMGIRFHELQTVLMRRRLWHWFRRRYYDGVLGEYIGVFDGVLDFGVQHLFRQHFTSENIDSTGFQTNVIRHYQRFPNEFVLPAFLDNHDMDRFMFHCNNDIACLQATATELFRLPQPVILYYGTESGMTQPRSIWSLRSHGDLMVRKPMNWDTVDWKLFRFFQELIQKRHQ